MGDDGRRLRPGRRPVEAQVLREPSARRAHWAGDDPNPNPNPDPNPNPNANPNPNTNPNPTPILTLDSRPEQEMCLTILEKKMRVAKLQQWSKKLSEYSLGILDHLIDQEEARQLLMSRDGQIATVGAEGRRVASALAL